jgi:uncharacterized protein (TIRG00374 family)
MNSISTNEDAVIKKAFSWWKIWLAIFLGLSIASWMMYKSLTKQQFIPVEKGKGDYIWIGHNKTNTPNLSIISDFKKSTSGNFKIETLSDTLTSIEWTSTSFYWLLGAIVCMIGRDLFYMIRVRILTKKSLTWKGSFNVIMLWEFASALSPGVMSGATVAMFIMNREKVPLGTSTAIVIITAFMDNLFYVLMIPFVFLFIDQETLFPVNFNGSEGVKWIFWIGFMIKILLCLFLFSSIFLFPKLISRFLSGLFSLPFLKRWQANAIKTSTEIEIASKEFKNEPRSFWFKSFFATVCSWTSRYLVINCILNAFLGLSLLENIQILGKQLVLWLLMMISPTPGGSGVAEYAFGELLSTFSSSAILIASLAILWRLVSYFPYLFIGAILLPRWLKKSKM